MRRIEYRPEDIATLKKEYLQIFDKERSEMQKLWEPLRDKLRKISSKPDLYNDNIDDILIADFDFLAKLYCDFTKHVETTKISSEECRDLEAIFHYSKTTKKKSGEEEAGEDEITSNIRRFQPDISAFFMRRADKLKIHTCHYCEISYINAYGYKMLFQNVEELLDKASLEDLAYFIPKADGQPISLKSAKTVYTIKDKFGKVYAHGTVGTHHIPIGNLYSLGSVDMTLEAIDTPQKLNLEVRIEGSDAVNDWNFWVYPAQVELVQGTVYTTDTLDAKALAVLQDGGNVLITAAGKIQYGKEVKQYFTPVFWNTSWFKMRPPHTTGIFLNEYHPLFREFPTEYHSNLQWWELLNKAQVMQFTDFPATFQPTVQSIDTWFISRKIGMLFEAKVLNGKLMMTSMDITSQPEKRIVARQMHKAILDYMNSDAFRPADKIAPELIQALFTKVAGDVKSYTKDSPDELKPKIN